MGRAINVVLGMLIGAMLLSIVEVLIGLSLK